MPEYQPGTRAWRLRAGVKPPASQPQQKNLPRKGRFFASLPQKNSPAAGRFFTLFGCSHTAGTGAAAPSAFLCHRGSRPLADALEDRQHRTPPFGQRVLHPGRDLVVGPPLHQAVVDDETPPRLRCLPQDHPQKHRRKRPGRRLRLCPDPERDGLRAIRSSAPPAMLRRAASSTSASPSSARSRCPTTAPWSSRWRTAPSPPPAPNVGKSFENVQW